MNLTLLDLSEAKKSAIEARTSLTVESTEGWADTFTGMRTASGQIVTRATALRCSAVLACIRILTEDIASLPLLLKKKTPKGAVEATDHPVYRMLKTSPNPLQTSIEAREALMFDLLTCGKFFGWVDRLNGRPRNIYPLDASAVSFRGMDGNGDLVWDSGDINYTKKTFLHTDLWRGTILNTNLVDGRSIVLLAREAIGLAMAAQEQGARLFSQGIQTDLQVVVPEGSTLDEEGVTQLRNALMSRHAGSANSFMPFLAQGGAKLERIGLTAEESQFIESRHYSLADVARIMRIPGVLLGIAGSATFASASEFFQSYAKHTLMPYAIRFEQSAERDLLLPSESDYSISHQFSALLRADQKTRFETYKIGIEGSFMQPIQARREEGWEEIDGLDFTLTPANFNIVRDGKVVVSAKPTDPANPPNDPKNPPKEPKTGQNTGNSAKLAASIAASILRSEAREFARQSRKTAPSEAQAANFAAWHVEKVMELTGAEGAAARSYSDWRFANPDADAEARERLTNLCLEGAL